MENAISIALWDKYISRVLMDVVIHHAHKIKDGMDSAVLLFNVLRIHTLMEHNVFLLSLQINVGLGSSGMEQNVCFMRIGVLSSQSGMEPFVSPISQIALLAFMEMEIVVCLSLSFVLLQQHGLEINALLVLIALIQLTIEMVIAIPMFLARMDNNGTKILSIVFVLKAPSGMEIVALVVLVAKDGFLL